MKYLILLKISLILMLACSGSKESPVNKKEIQHHSTLDTAQKKEKSRPMKSRMSKEFLHGTWQNTNHQDIDFILHLNLVDELVLGEYCSKAKSFFLEDCALEDEGGYCSVRGPFNHYNVEVSLESCLNAEIGEAFLRRENQFLKLVLDKPAGTYGVDHLVPDTINLKKISNEPLF